MAYYHGTIWQQVKPGSILVPGRKARRSTNYRMTMHLLTPEELAGDVLVSGRVLADDQLVWLSTNSDEAYDWASGWFLKCVYDDLIQLKITGFAVCEVEPIGEVDRRVVPHGEGEWCCDSARVLKVDWNPIDPNDWKWDDE